MRWPTYIFIDHYSLCGRNEDSNIYVANEYFADTVCRVREAHKGKADRDGPLVRRRFDKLPNNCQMLKIDKAILLTEASKNTWEASQRKN